MTETKVQASPFEWIDRPITSKSEDRLNRASFAGDLARAIKSWDGNDSLVLGLYGNWGSGKTSIKNMVLETLKTGQDTLHILEFNPWQVSGFNQLTEHFFTEIGTEIGKWDKNLQKRWRHYSARLLLHKNIAECLNKFLGTGLVSVGIIGAGASFCLGPHALKITIACIGIVSLFLGIIEKVSSSISTYLTEIDKKDLTETKNELSRELRMLEKPILVVLDDLDRLPNQQVPLLFQLIKANADFPKLVYLTLFQRDIIAKALNHDHFDGNAFLEKIIQVGFDVPEPNRQMIQQTLFDGLNKLIASEHVNKRFDKRRWINVFVPGIAPYCKTLRDVNRFLSTLSFTIGLFMRKGCFEVNPVDLIALEVLRVFEPDVYHQIPYFKSSFVRSSARDDKDISGPILSCVKDSSKNPEAVRELLKGLFPNAEWIFGGTRYADGFSNEWIQELRVGTDEFFDRYFALSISEQDIAQKDIEDVLALAGDRNGMAAKLTEFKRRGLISPLLERLDAYKQKIDISNAVPFIAAICDVSDDLPNRQGFLTLGDDMHAWRIIYFYLLQEKDEAKRVEILRKSLSETIGLFMPVKIVSFEEPRKDNSHGDIKRLVQEMDLPVLKEICVSKIKSRTDTDLLKHPYLAYILYRWKEWENVETVKKWIQKQIATKEGFYIILRTFSQKTYAQSLGEYATRVDWQMDAGFLEYFQIKTDMEKAIKRYEVQATTDEKKFITLLKDALANKNSGLHKDADTDSEYI